MHQQEPLQEQINSIIALISSGQKQEVLDAAEDLMKYYPKKMITLKLIQQ